MPIADPGPAYRTISDVATEIGVPQHVLRFWEGKFPQVAPMKRAGGRRYYRPADIATLATIARLLHAEGYTIKGAQKLLAEGGGAAVAQRGRKASVAAAPAAAAHDTAFDLATGPVASAAAAPAEANDASSGFAPALLDRLAAIRADLAGALAAARAL